MSRSVKEWSKHKQVDCMMGLYVYLHSEAISLAPSLKKLIKMPDFVPLNEIREEF